MKISADALQVLFCSNRTFMELKFVELIAIHRAGEGSNRTFMELKYCRGRGTTRAPYSSNRTFMELKYLCRRVGGSNLWF